MAAPLGVSGKRTAPPDVGDVTVCVYERVDGVGRPVANGIDHTRTGLGAAGVERHHPGFGVDQLAVAERFHHGDPLCHLAQFRRGPVHRLVDHPTVDDACAESEEIGHGCIFARL